MIRVMCLESCILLRRLVSCVTTLSGASFYTPNSTTTPINIAALSKAAATALPHSSPTHAHVSSSCMRACTQVLEVEERKRRTQEEEILSARELPARIALLFWPRLKDQMRCVLCRMAVA